MYEAQNSASKRAPSLPSCCRPARCARHCPVTGPSGHTMDSIHRVKKGSAYRKHMQMMLPWQCVSVLSPCCVTNVPASSVEAVPHLSVLGKRNVMITRCMARVFLQICAASLVTCGMPYRLRNDPNILQSTPHEAYVLASCSCP